ncbi:hypothetical protein D3C76_1554870 [compost metagenome]
MVACAQSTPLVPSRPCIRALATPTPMIEPIRVCDDDAGKPSHQVPRFHRIAAISRAKIMANPAEEPTCRISSTGNNAMMPNATAPLDSSTPRKLKNPDQTTAKFGGSECV